MIKEFCYLAIHFSNLEVIVSGSLRMFGCIPHPLILNTCIDYRLRIWLFLNNGELFSPQWLDLNLSDACRYGRWESIFSLAEGSPTILCYLPPKAQTGSRIEMFRIATVTLFTVTPFEILT
jgi:hypothetical protein